MLLLLIFFERVEAFFREEFRHVVTCSSTDIRDKPFLGCTEELFNDILIDVFVFFLHMEISEGLPEDLLPFPNFVDLFFDVVVSLSDTDNVPLSRSHHFLEEIASWELVGHFKDDKIGVLIVRIFLE